MATAKRKSMDAWIHEALTDDDKEHKCTAIALMHVNANGSQKEIHTTKFSGGKSWAALDLARMFDDKAKTYAQDLDGTQTFVLLAFYGKNEPEASQPFKVYPSGGDYLSSPLNSEPPNEKGALAQAMRQKELVFGQLFARQHQLDEYSNGIIAMQARTITELARENREMFTTFKEILAERALNTHKYQMEQLQFERSTAERKKWIAYLPALVNTVLGREVFPQNVADTALVEQIADGLSEKDIIALAQHIPPSLAGPLMMRMQTYLEKKNAEEAEIKRFALTKGDDSDLVGGK